MNTLLVMKLNRRLRYFEFVNFGGSFNLEKNVLQCM